MFSSFRTEPYAWSGVLHLAGQRQAIDLNPPYQRQGSLWTLVQKQLLMDSILNAFNMPKIYLHQFPTKQDKTGQRFTAAVIDGKQRLEAIWGFMDGDFALADDFVFFDDPELDAGGATYHDLATDYAILRSRFDGTELSVVAVHTDDTDLLEDLFTRLNTQTNLTPGERRNALGGAIPPVLRRLAQHPFFTESIPFDTSRYRDRDLAAKFLYITSQGDIVTTKKKELDDFVGEYKATRPPLSSGRDRSLREQRRKKTRLERRARALERRVEDTLKRMHEFFRRSDDALRGQGVTTLFFHLFRLLGDSPTPRRFKPEVLSEFQEEVRATDRKQRRMAEGSGEGLTAGEQRLAEFLRHSQSLNDAYAIRSRYRVLRDELADRYRVKLPDPE